MCRCPLKPLKATSPGVKTFLIVESAQLLPETYWNHQKISGFKYFLHSALVNNQIRVQLGVELGVRIGVFLLVGLSDSNKFYAVIFGRAAGYPLFVKRNSFPHDKFLRSHVISCSTFLCLGARRNNIPSLIPLKQVFSQYRIPVESGIDPPCNESLLLLQFIWF